MRLLSHKQVPRAIQIASQMCMIQLVTESNNGYFSLDGENKHSTPTELQSELDSYRDIFQEPTSLPPSRGPFNQIPLEKGTSPINRRPYRYLLKKNDVIEKLLGDMIEKGVIQMSSSPFASPVVLVGKKDGT